MTATVKKPTAYVFGTKKEDAPKEPTLTKEQLEKMIEDVQKYIKR